MLGVSIQPLGVSMLTDKAAQATLPKDRPYKLSDSGGLYLFVTPKGGKSWRLKYRYYGKEKLLVLGRYPAMSLKQARAAREDAKRILASGQDPSLESKRARLAAQHKATETFEQWAREWYGKMQGNWKPVHANDVITSLERDIFPSLGSYPIEDIDRMLMKSVLQQVENRGAIETAARLRQRCEKIFEYAIASGSECGNPAHSVKAALKRVPKSKMRPAIVDLDALRIFVREIDQAACMPTTRLASRFLAITAQRPGMVRAMPWTELHGIDWSNPDAPSPDAVWKVPASRMKLELALGADSAWDHSVPLPQQAVDVLHAVRRLTGNGMMVFPSTWASHKPMSENTLTYLYNRLGYQGKHCAHGWRSSFSTIMNGRMERQAFGMERFNLDRLIIDLMLAHKPSGMSGDEFVYNRHAYMDRRRELATAWADMLLQGAAPAMELIEGRRRGVF